MYSKKIKQIMCGTMAMIAYSAICLPVVTYSTTTAELETSQEEVYSDWMCESTECTTSTKPILTRGVPMYSELVETTTTSTTSTTTTSTTTTLATTSSTETEPTTVEVVSEVIAETEPQTDVPVEVVESSTETEIHTSEEITTTSEVPSTTTGSTTSETVQTIAGLKKVPVSDDLNQFIYDMAIEHGLPYEWVLATIRLESNFNSKAVSSSGCVGLMQISKRYNRDVDLYDPYQNVRRGCEIMQQCYQKAGGNLRMAYTYYNLGLYCKRSSPNGTSAKVYNYYIEYLNS